MEIGGDSTTKPKICIIGKRDNLYVKSGELDQYKGFVVSDINANDGTLPFEAVHTASTASVWKV